ncbi:MAG: hypothetical protein EOP51_33970, partial [Sphingobacteriales bacterium]
MFTATAINGGTQPTYEWLINGNSVFLGNQNALSIDTLTANSVVEVILTSGLSCLTAPQDTSDAITVIVHPVLVPSVAIVASATTVCTGETVSFTATPVNGGSAPVYQWTLNGVNVGANAPGFTATNLSNGDEVKVVLTSNASCVSSANIESNGIIILVQSSVEPVVEIGYSQTIICENNAVTFNAVNQSNLGNPTYEWLVDGNLVSSANSASFTHQFAPGSHAVTVRANSSLACAVPSADTFSISVTVQNSVDATVVIPSSYNVNMGESALISATVQNAGTAPLYQWQDSTAMHTWQNIPSASQMQISYLPQTNGDKIRVNVVSSLSCSPSTAYTSNVLSFIV